MKNIIVNNAYGILGLLPNSTQKEVSKRNKEVEKFLQIGEVPEYAFDFSFYNQNRTLQNVRNSFFNISNINTQIMHHFFRVYANNDDQLKILNNIEQEFLYEHIFEIYKNTNNKNFITQKNIAILLSILLMSEKIDNVEEISNFCINLWHTIVCCEKNTKDYKKIFLLDDELGINESILDNLDETVVNELTNVFSDIAKLHKNNQILATFIDKFQLKETIFSLDTIEEIYSNIYEAIKELDNLNISEDGVFDDNEKRILKTCLQQFQDEFNKLIDLGLYENEKTIILRDLVATKIRIQILDLFNNLEEDETALNLMNFAIYIVGTEGLKSKLKDELRYITDNISISSYVNPICELIDRLQRKNGQINAYDIESFAGKVRKMSIDFSENNKVNLLDKNKAINSMALKIRAISIDLYNKYKKFKEAQLLLVLALELAKTNDLINLCKKDLLLVNNTVSEHCGFNGFCNSELGGCLGAIFCKIFAYAVMIGIFALIGAIFGG